MQFYVYLACILIYISTLSQYLHLFHTFIQFVIVFMCNEKKTSIYNTHQSQKCTQQDKKQTSNCVFLIAQPETV